MNTNAKSETVFKCNECFICLIQFATFGSIFSF